MEKLFLLYCIWLTFLIKKYANFEWKSDKGLPLAIEIIIKIENLSINGLDKTSKYLEADAKIVQLTVV